MIFSATNCQRNRAVSHPNTFWMLMLLMRIGMRAILKLVWLTTAIRSTINAMTVSIVVLLALPLFTNSSPFAL